MAVDKIAGAVAVHQGVEGVEAHVGQVLPVIQPQGGGVGQQDVKPALAHQGQLPLPHPPVHLPLGILVLPLLLIPHGAPQAQDAHPFVGVDLVLHADTALRRHRVVTVVVVAVDVEHRPVGKGGDKGQIAGVQVAAGEDQVDPLQALGVKVVPEPQGLLVRQRQNLHRPSSPFSGFRSCRAFFFREKAWCSWRNPSFIWVWVYCFTVS